MIGEITGTHYKIADRLYIAVIAYSEVPNKSVTFLLFLWFFPTYMALLGPTRLLISEIFPSKPDFHLYKREKILPTQPY